MIFSWKKLGVLAVILGFFSITSLPTALAQSSITDIPIPDDLTSSSSTFGFDVGPTENDLDLTMTPENPGAFEPVSIKLSSDYINLSRYQIDWFVDGKLMSGGIGKQFFTTETKNYGVATTIIITVKLTDQTIQKKVVLLPEDVSVIWEAIDSYVPPFYQGKRLPAREALLNIVTIPNFSNTQNKGFDPRTGIYGWKRNNLPVANVGGYGKDSFIFQHNKIRGIEKITVTAQDIEGNHSATKDITLSFFDPKILFYEHNPETGLRNILAKKSISLNKDEVSIEAIPYFFSVLKNDPNGLKTTWTMNGQNIPIVDTRNKTSLTIKAPGGSGTATIGITVENTNKLFQSATQQISAMFQK